MALNPLYTIEQLPTTSQAAIREFNDRYIAAIGASKPTGWADENGELIPTSSPLVTFPVSQLRTLYRRSTGEQSFKKLRETSVDLRVEEFDDGYQADLMDLFLKAFAYRNWAQAPARLVLAEEQFRHTSVANLLVNGATTLGVDGVDFFGSTHPANLTDPTITSTWSNLQSTPADYSDPTTGISSLQTEVVNMQKDVLDENGNVLGANPDTILCPIDMAEPLKNLLAKNLILQVGSGAADVAVAAVDNPYKGRFNVVHVKEFPLTTGTTKDIYLIDSKLARGGVPPWVSARLTVPGSLALRVFDESSDFFKDTGNIKMSSHIWYGFGLLFPHAIRKLVGETR